MSDARRRRRAPRAVENTHWAPCWLDVLAGGVVGVTRRVVHRLLADRTLAFRRFILIVSPTCPVAGYLNCLAAGPKPLQVSLTYRFLLPTATFTPKAFRGPYGLPATYVGRPR